MKIIGVDLHTRQQTIAMLDDQTGELVEQELQHEGEEVRRFYSALPKPVLVGLEATGSMHWFLRLLEELNIEYRVGHPAKIRAAEPRKQKNDRRDARLLLTLLAENRFPAIWMPSREQHDLQPRSVRSPTHSHTAELASAGAQSRATARALLVDARRPTHPARVAAGCPCPRAARHFTGAVSTAANSD